MLKKKNIAMMMAAATVVTAAPAYAAPQTREVVNSTEEAKIKEIKDKVAKMYTVRFTENASLLKEGTTPGSSIYSIVLIGADNKEKTCNNYAEFEKAFDEMVENLQSGQTIKVKYTEKANRVLEDGQIVDNEEVKYEESDFIDGDTDAEDAVNNVTTTDNRKIIVETNADMTKVAKIQISDENGKERFITVKAGDVKLDLTKPVYRQVNGYYVDANNTPIKKVDNSEVEKFGDIENGVIDGYYAFAGNLANGDKITYDAIVKDEVKKVELNASELYEFYSDGEGRLTREGNEIFKKLAETHGDDNYEIKLKEKVTKNNVLEVIKINKDKPGTVVSEITVKDDQDRKDVDAYSFLVGTNGTNLLALATTASADDLAIKIAAGNDRYETAVEIAKKGFTGDVNEVVLVSGSNDKLVDGLTATPLASTLNTNDGAPVLLTQAGKLPESVVKFLQDKKTTKVYIVGGESAVNKTVENELKNRYGIAVERIEGKDRYETSLNVAKQVQDKNEKDDTNVFVVGGRAEADALSISAVAGREEQPIVLVPQSGMTNEIKYALKGIKNVDIIGGETSVSSAVAQELVDAGAVVARTKGSDRQETNAAVIAKFNKDAASEIVFAKSNNAALVDALGAGAYAAVKEAPLVLATETLTESQEDALQTHKGADDKTQAGYGIKDVVAKFIAGLK